MGRGHRIAVTLGLAVAAGCATAPKPVPIDPRITRRDHLLGQLREHHEEIAQARERFLAAAQSCERSKDVYQAKLSVAMASRKASARELKSLEKNREQLAQMIQDRDRVGEDLKKVFEALIAARKKRNATMYAMLELEGKLWVLEERLGGGRAALEQRASAELDEVRKTGKAVLETDQVQSAAEAAVIGKEVELAGLIGADAKMRDEADQALDKLREKLEAAATSYVAAAAAQEAAKARYHQKTRDTLPPPPPSLAEALQLKGELTQAIDRRSAAAKLLDETQNVIKTAMIDRAAQTKQRMAFDSEIDRVVEAGLTLKGKQAALAELAAEIAAIDSDRKAMLAEDTATLALQRKIGDTEAELDALGY